jgi:hypothetical protein
MTKLARIKNEEDLDSSVTFYLLITTPMTLLWRGPSNLHYWDVTVIPVNTHN